MSNYEELIGKHEEYKKQKNHYEKLQKEVVAQLNDLMHEDELLETSVFIHDLDQEFTVKYIDRENKKVDYQLLAEILSSDDYQDVIQTSQSSFLKISPTPVSKSKPTISKPTVEKSTTGVKTTTNTIKGMIPKGKFS